jgi:hypothetical protein
MTFERVDADSFVLLEVETGSNIGSARDRKGLFALLDKLDETDRERLPLVVVVALDKKGQRIDSWAATSILTEA